jgi:ubiquinone biosynthesis protein
MLNPELIPTRLVEASERPKLDVVEPTRERFRNARSVFYLLEWALGTLWLKLLRKDSAVESAKRLSKFLERMGGLWVKAGQLLSLRSDIFSPEFCNELSKLQYRAAAFPWAIANQTLEEELGRPVEQVFDEFETHPFAAASISQVYRAHLKAENEWVAVKVQRPDIEGIFSRDLALFRFVFGLFARFNVLSHLRWNEMFWEIRQIVVEETDYRYEQSNLRRMKKTLKKHKIYVPTVYDRWSRKRVLTMEFVTGALMSDYIRLRQTDPMRLEQWLAENNIQPRKLGVRLMTSFLRQLLEDNLFHGDLHPGNIILLKDSRVALIDLGTVGSFETRFLTLYKLVMYAMGNKDYAKAADILFLMCESLPPVDLEQVKAEVVRAYRAWDARAPLRGIGYHEKSIGSVGQETGRIMFEHKIVASWQFMKATRTLGTLDASLNYLIADMDHAEVTRKYQKGAAKRAWKRLREVGIKKMVSKAIAGANEFALFEGASLRRQAQVFQGATSKVADLFSHLFLNAGRFVTVAAVLLTLVYLRQQGSPLTAGLDHLRVFRWASATVPKMATDEWVMVGVAVLYTRHVCGKLRRRFAQKEVRVGGTREGF